MSTIKCAFFIYSNKLFPWMDTNYDENNFGCGDLNRNRLKNELKRKIMGFSNRFGKSYYG